MDDYRQRKELFVSHLSGTTLFETGSIVINICATYFLCQLIPRTFAREYLILVIPMILVCTLFSSITHVFHILIWLIGFSAYFLQTKNLEKKSPVQKNPSYSRVIEIFRGQIIIVTCICILAVDFPIFPRRYAKTEDYGYSGMDLGVGLFAIAHGMVSSEARNKQTNLRDLFLENFILLILGLVRFISIKYFSYVEHVSEYGVHWNFFLTLCLMKLIANGLLNLTKNIPGLIIAVLVFHEGILLRYFHWDNYVILSENLRDNFFDANREGIISLGGYVALYLIGIYIGRWIIQYERKEKFIQMSVIFSIAMIILCALNFNSSRKLCNLWYISSTTGLACMCIAGFSFVHWLLERKGYLTESILLKNINQKGLDIFLLANVLTGLVNLNINTIDSSDGISLLILMIYMFLVMIYAYYCPSVIKLMMKFVRLTK